MPAKIKTAKSKDKRPPMPGTDPHRSWTMSRVAQKDTKPEMTVRRLVHGLGYRYRLHKKGLPGTPDLVFASKRKVIFVHGCFWHAHSEESCKLARPPKSRLEYWGPKLARNAERDHVNEEKLRADGWQVMVVWECQLRDMPSLENNITNFLDPKSEVA